MVAMWRFIIITLIGVVIVQNERARRNAVATQVENQAKIDTILGVVQKIKSEVETLKAAPADQVLDFSGVDAALQEVDDLNTDAVVEPTEPETPVDPEAPASA